MTHLRTNTLALLVSPLLALAAWGLFAPAAMACDMNAGSADCPSDTVCTPNSSGSTVGSCKSTGTNASLGPAGATPSAAALAGAGSNGATPPKDKSGTDTSTYGFLMTMLMGLFAWLLGVATITLDNAVYYSVVTMGSYIHGLSAIGVSWRILRDIGNIFLIFGFLIAGIATIIDLDIYGYGSKMLPMLLVAAIFLNFSLFISEAIIDFGNIFATEFYTQINNGQIPTTAQLSYTSNNIHNEGISNRIMGVLGLQQLYSNAQSKNDTITGASVQSGQGSNLLNANTPWYVGFLGIILFLIAAFVMFSLAFILIARFVALIFLIVIAPIGFAGLAVPKLSKTAQMWWSQLAEQTITAPVLLLLLYVALAVITDAKFFTCSGSNCSWTGFTGSASDLGGFATLVFTFLVAMALLLAVVVIAKRMSAFGAGMATRMGGRLTFGAVSFAGRATLGGIGNLGASKRAQAWAERGGKYGKYLRRIPVFAAKGLRSGTYDPRNAGVSSALGALGIDAGKGATVTAKRLYETGYGYKPVQKYFADSNAEYAAAKAESDLRVAQRNIGDAQTTLNSARANHAAGRINPAQLAAAEAQYLTDVAPHEKVLKEGMAKMSTKQLEELTGIKSGIDALVTNLSPQQFENLMKSDKLTDAQKGGIKTARYRALSGAVATGSVTDVKKVLNAYSKGELESMPADLLTKPVVLDELSDTQRTTITDSKDRTAAEKDAVRAASPSGRVESIYRTAGGGVAGGLAVATAPEFGRLNAPQIVRLEKEILLQPAVVANLAPAALAKIQDENKFTPGEMKVVGAAIMADPHAAGHAYITGPGGALWR